MFELNLPARDKQAVGDPPEMLYMLEENEAVELASAIEQHGQVRLSVGGELVALIRRKQGAPLAC